MRDSLKDIAFMLKNIPYPKELPDDISHLHCYVSDGGHSILAVPQPLMDEAKGRYTLYEVPLPVKYVLEKGWQHIDDTDCIAVDVPYNNTFGAEVPDGYEEF